MTQKKNVTPSSSTKKNKKKSRTNISTGKELYYRHMSYPKMTEIAS